jgi:hypothetical protein
MTTKMEESLEKLTRSGRLALVYLRGIAATITVTLIGAAVVGALRFLGGP